MRAAPFPSQYSYSVSTFFSPLIYTTSILFEKSLLLTQGKAYSSFQVGKQKEAT